MLRRSAAPIVFAIFAAGCTSTTAPVETTTASQPTSSQTETTETAPAEFDVLAFGDAADCRTPSENVAKLVTETPGEVLIVGDIAYPVGSKANIDDCFSPLYDSTLDRLHAVPGDNDYKTDDATPFFDKLGADRAGQSGQGWWAFTREAWQIIGINSECSRVNCGPKSDQYAFIAEQLEAEPDACRLVIWHKPRFTSSSNYSGLKNMGDLYQLLYDNGADILVVGNSHHYERFEPLGPDGTPDADGIANFTVGTGGAPYTEFGEPLPGSAVRDNETRGVVKFTLSPNGYAWEFLSVGDGALQDSGIADCHNRS